MTYGANTIGGAIDLVGMKPTRRFELSAKIGAMSGKGYETNINLGSNLGKMYIQARFFSSAETVYTAFIKFRYTALETDHHEITHTRKI